MIGLKHYILNYCGLRMYYKRENTRKTINAQECNKSADSAG